ncbi:transmembrane protein 116 [Mugil cephalus]|uniref:transmembrane protein 116 n=1 Tax=Mugil cephalus TaxID=48193 RepID=UPI001FB5935C|nr:transmembrane protein 116 [Mugil cephalus]
MMFDFVMNTTRAEDWTEVYEVVQWIQLVMGLLSVLGSSSIIICLMMQRLSRKPELQPLFLLSVADLLLAACWLTGVVLYSQHCSSLSTYCYNMHIVEQILFMASFFYTLNYVWDLYIGFREKFYSCLSGHSVQISNRVRTPAKIISVLSCLVPVLLMTPVFIQGNISQCQTNFSQPYRCLLMHTGSLFLTSDHVTRPCSVLHIYHVIVFLTTFMFTFVGITVLVVKSRRIYRRVVTSSGYLGNEQRASFRLMDRRMLLYPLVFVLCWGPAVSLALLRVVKPSEAQGRASVVLYISQALTSASQGFLNCLVYGWTRVHLSSLRAGGTAASSRDVDTQTPLLRSQKKRSYQTLRSLS